MRTLKLQFFFAYAIMGNLVPFLPIYLKREQGLNEAQIGWILGLAGVSILLTPIFMTLLADTKFDPRRLVAFVFATSGAALAVLYFSHGFLIVLLLLGIHSLAHAAVIPLHDGITFGLQRQMEKKGLIPNPYHSIRVWGSIGFILPSLALFGLFTLGQPLSIVLLGGVAFSLLAFLNALRLPDSKLSSNSTARRIPTLQAARVLFRPDMRIFCLGLFLVFVAAGGFSTFYPLYMVDVVGVDSRWVGLIFNFGVVVEIFFMLGFGRLQNRFGLRNLILFGISAYALQTLFLGLFPTVLTAILVQLLHGAVIIGLYVAPIMYINRHAGDHFRNSIQGLYAMIVIGLARIGGVVLAGQFSGTNLKSLPLIASGLATLAAILLFISFRRQAESALPKTVAEPQQNSA